MRVLAVADVGNADCRYSFEAAVRMIWGEALLTIDRRCWLLWFNVASGVLPRIPERSHEALRHLAGRYGPLFARLVPRYLTQE